MEIALQENEVLGSLLLSRETEDLSSQLKTFVDLARDLEKEDDSDAIGKKAGIVFNRKDYVAKREVSYYNVPHKLSYIIVEASSLAIDCCL